MKANELRIGNYVKGNRIGKVKSIYSTHFQVDDEKCISLGNSLQENFKPIPLTEDILLKCGFEKTDGCGNWHFSLHEIFKTKHFFKVGKLDNYFYWYNQVDDDYYSYMHDIQYLHQLQNLYFALTGEELTINL